MTAILEIRLGELLRRARLDARLTQTKLAEQIGVSQSEVSRWERGEECPTVIEARALARVTEAEYLYDLRDLPAC